MSFHTFEASYNLTKTEYDSLSKKLSKLHSDFYQIKTKSKSKLKLYQSNILIDHGVLIYLQKNVVSANNENYNYYKVLYRVNPRRTVGEKTYIGMITI